MAFRRLVAQAFGTPPPKIDVPKKPAQAATPGAATASAAPPASTADAARVRRSHSNSAKARALHAQQRSSADTPEMRARMGQLKEKQDKLRCTAPQPFRGQKKTATAAPPLSTNNAPMAEPIVFDREEVKPIEAPQPNLAHDTPSVPKTPARQGTRHLPKPTSAKSLKDPTQMTDADLGDFIDAQVESDLDALVEQLAHEADPSASRGKIPEEQVDSFVDQLIREAESSPLQPLR
jgi:hypothetical protein